MFIYIYIYIYIYLYIYIYIYINIIYINIFHIYILYILYFIRQVIQLVCLVGFGPKLVGPGPLGNSLYYQIWTILRGSVAECFPYCPGLNSQITLQPSNNMV